MRESELSRFELDLPTSATACVVSYYGSAPHGPVHLWFGGGAGGVSTSVMLTRSDVERLYIALDSALAALTRRLDE